MIWYRKIAPFFARLGIVHMCEGLGLTRHHELWGAHYGAVGGLNLLYKHYVHISKKNPFNMFHELMNEKTDS